MPTLLPRDHSRRMGLKPCRVRWVLWFDQHETPVVDVPACPSGHVETESAQDAGIEQGQAAQ
jgi:hypothetical protein